jgi:hypothetical protein
MARVAERARLVSLTSVESARRCEIVKVAGDGEAVCGDGEQVGVDQALLDGIRELAGTGTQVGVRIADPERDQHALDRRVLAPEPSEDLVEAPGAIGVAIQVDHPSAAQQEKKRGEQIQALGALPALFGAYLRAFAMPDGQPRGAQADERADGGATTPMIASPMDVTLPRSASGPRAGWLRARPGCSSVGRRRTCGPSRPRRTTPQRRRQLPGLRRRRRPGRSAAANLRALAVAS